MSDEAQSVRHTQSYSGFWIKNDLPSKVLFPAVAVAATVHPPLDRKAMEFEAPVPSDLVHEGIQ